MDWTDQGTLLSVRKHGEGSAIIEVFTENHGRHAGVVRGGGSRKMAALLQPGGQLSVAWRARLVDHIGSFSVELIRSRTTNIMSGRAQIAAFGALSSIIITCLPEREPQGRLYAMTALLLDKISTDLPWLGAYVRWEMAVLNELGFGLDLGSCAATGTTDELAFVSPKSARAVSRAGAAGWEDKLLKLPQFLVNPSIDPATRAQVLDGLKLTGYFLNNGIMAANGRAELPKARERFLQVLEKP